ncbi:MAG: DUF4493 domain-containing protein [Alistipes sp.]|nr:DUF4493 domain-containing protein [Alistipes sp.]
MKKFITYILAGIIALSAAACAQSDVDGGMENMGTLQLNLGLSNATRSEGYDALARSTMRIYKLEEGEEVLIRKYTPATEVPSHLYLVAGQYRVKVQAGDQSNATFTNKSYYGEADILINPHEIYSRDIICHLTNIGVQVNFDQTISEKMSSYRTYVSTIDTFSKTEAENGSVPTLTYTEDGQGYYLLPEGVSNLSWGFYGSGEDLGEVQKTGVIANPEAGKLYTLTFKYSKTPNGYLGITVQIEENGEIFDDPFIFNPQPTISGDGFSLGTTVGYHTDPISFSVTSVEALDNIVVETGGQKFPILTSGAEAPEAAANGIRYTATDASNGKIAFDGTFFSKFPCGIQTLEFTLTDAAAIQGIGTSRIAIPGLKSPECDLWFGTADFQEIVTDPAASSDRQIRYRSRPTGTEEFGEWHYINAKLGDDFTSTARATDFAAGYDYEYQLVVNGSTGTLRSFSTEAGVQVPNGGFETWSYLNGKVPFPCEESAIGSNGMGTGYTGFWGTGNPGGSSFNIIPTSAVEDHRPGSSGTMCALMETKSAIITIAAGNIFIGSFGRIHHTTKGDVYMGRPFAFNARPKALRFWVKGNVGSNDKASLFVCMGKWQGYHTVDTNDTSTFIDLKTNHKTLPGGDPITGYALWQADTLPGEWQEVVLEINYNDEYIDNRPTHLMITASSSYRGDYMEGSTDSKLYLDDIEFVY